MKEKSESGKANSKLYVDHRLPKKPADKQYNALHDMTWSIISSDVVTILVMVLFSQSWTPFH